jgi:CheY-like chemotaxis protein
LSFDAIFMDCNMPVMDGFKATSIIHDKICRGEMKPTPIVGNTAFPDSYKS